MLYFVLDDSPTHRSGQYSEAPDDAFFKRVVNHTLTYYEALKQLCIYNLHITSVGFEVFSQSPTYEKRKKLRR